MLKMIRELGVKVSLIFDPSKVAAANASISQMAEGLKGVGVAVAGSVASLAGFTGAFSGNARDLEQVSNELGLNVEQFQKLEYAMKVTAGVSRNELTSSLEGISKTLFESQNNSTEAGRALIRMGVPLDIVTGKLVNGKMVYQGVDKALMVLADRFAAMPNGIYKTALAAELGVQRLLPGLNKGSKGIQDLGKEGEGLGAVLSKDMIAKGAEFDRQWSKIWIILKGISYTIGFQLTKYLKPFVTEFQKFIKLNREFIAVGITQVVKSMGFYLEGVYKVVKAVADRFKYLVTVLGGVEKVSKYVGLAMAVFTGIKIVGAIGTLISSFSALAGIIGIIASPAVAMGAAFLGLFLIIQDLMSNDSLIMEWFDEFKESFPQMAGLAQDFGSVMVKVSSMIVEGWKNIWSWIEPIKNWFESGAIGEYMGKIEKFVGFLRSGAIGEKLFDFFHPTQGLTAAATAPTPVQRQQSAGYIDPSGKESMQLPKDAVQNNNFVSNVSISIPTGTSHTAAIDMVAKGQQKSFDQHLRHTRDQHLGGKKY